MFFLILQFFLITVLFFSEKDVMTKYKIPKDIFNEKVKDYISDNNIENYQFINKPISENLIFSAKEFLKYR